MGRWKASRNKKFVTMPAYSFQERFIPVILDRSKLHTIRKTCRIKPGQKVFIYYTMRTKRCRKIGEAICVAVQKILITRNSIRLTNPDGSFLDLVGLTADRLAWRDGFRPKGMLTFYAGGAFDLMKEFFSLNGGLPFEGYIIHWKDFVPAPPTSLTKKINA
jgi:hypothetical protein